MGSSGPRNRTSRSRLNAAEERFRRRMAAYESYQFQPLDMSQYALDLSKYQQENLLEDMPGMEAYTEAADYASERFQQSQANIMATYRGAAGASGIAGVAQAISGQATEFAREQQVGLGQRAAEARRLALQEQARLKGQERQLELMQDAGMRDLKMREQMTRRDFEYGKMTTLLGVEGEQLAGARQLYAAQLQAAAQRRASTLGFFGALAGAIGTYAGAAAAGAAGSDRKLKKNIKKEGKSKSGLQIYSFEYKDPKDGKGRWKGVIADDLPKSVKNKAVHKSADGYDMVDYSKIDVTLKQV